MEQSDREKDVIKEFRHKLLLHLSFMAIFNSGANHRSAISYKNGTNWKTDSNNRN